MNLMNMFHSKICNSVLFLLVYGFALTLGHAQEVVKPMMFDIMFNKDGTLY